MTRPGTRLGVDIGGTFTDVVLEREGVHHSVKVLTTYAAPEDAIIEGMSKVCGKAGISASSIEQIIHGTTLATNALIERRGAKTALVTTRGFRDVIEMRTESRFEQYDLNLVLPEPLLSRDRRHVVDERIGASGDVLVPLDRAGADELADELAGAGYESIAIGFLHAYANPSHERLMADILSKKLPGAMISLSSEVSPQMREYERFNTTIANAYIKPLMKSYLDRLQGRLSEAGADCPVFLMHSGGGIIDIKTASEFPVRLVESGPAGGAVFAADIAARYGLEKVLSFDMGGTTAKICLIKGKTPKTARVFEVARTYRFKKGSGMPISIPVIDMVEIGAGGGSLAEVDALGRIRVGPESAGSEPGPACYDRGGDRPAVTDADLVLGKLDPDHFAGGSIALAPALSERALREHIGEKLEMDALESAWGVSEVVDENMANAARVYAVENGEDLSDYTMIGFGGAAPLHAARICEKLGIDRCLVPVGAGVGSAIGFLRAPFSFESNRSVFMLLGDFDEAAVRSLFSEMTDESARFVSACAGDAEVLTEYKVYMRYSGQGWEIPVSLEPSHVSSPSAAEYLSLFEAEYEKVFGRSVEGPEVEIVVWSVNVFTRPEAVEAALVSDASLAVAGDGERVFFDSGAGGAGRASVVERRAMTSGGYVEGPAMVIEDETTIVVPSGRWVVAHPDGCLDMRRRESGT